MTVVEVNFSRRKTGSNETVILMDCPLIDSYRDADQTAVVVSVSMSMWQNSHINSYNIYALIPLIGCASIELVAEVLLDCC